MSFSFLCCALSLMDTELLVHSTMPAPEWSTCISPHGHLAAFLCSATSCSSLAPCLWGALNCQIPPPKRTTKNANNTALNRRQRGHLSAALSWTQKAEHHSCHLSGERACWATQILWLSACASVRRKAQGPQQRRGHLLGWAQGGAPAWHV